jgi:DNA-binding NarL/FixJ family response regulator
MTEAMVFRIVMVEDQASYAEAFGMALTLADDLELVGRASTTADGLRLCAVHTPDLVVSDYRLRRGETGTQFAQQLRDLDVTNPIALLTGYTAAQVAREASALPNVHLLSKDDSMAGQGNTSTWRPRNGSTIAGDPRATVRSDTRIQTLLCGFAHRPI